MQASLAVTDGDSGGKRIRKKSMSVAALDNVTFIDIFEDEVEMLTGINTEINNAFTIDELTRT